MKIKVLITRASNAKYFNCRVNDIVEVELEEYVAAVVASEIGNGHAEACCAQAIAARTFAVGRGVLNGKVISDASSTAQAYRAERYDFNKYPRCIKATTDTQGLILKYKDKPISAVYSASNGGRTVSAEEKWGSPRAYLIAQDDPWDAAANKPKHGHGVGMSQSGCGWAANHGYTYKQILAFYYPKTELGSVIQMNENLKAEAIVETAKDCLGYPYVFAAWGEECTPNNRKRRASDAHPTIISKCQVLNGSKKSCSGCKYQGTRIFDCRGFTYWVLKENGIVINGQGATSQWNDKANWVKQGPISEMPDCVCCVFQKYPTNAKMKHTGLHIGGGKVIHCSVEVKNDSVSRADWTHYAIPQGLYTKEELENMNIVQYRKTLKKGSKGDEVVELQTILQGLGFYNDAIDGKFGSGTEAAVRQYQMSRELTVDGVVGSDTWRFLLAEGHWPDGAPPEPEQPEFEMPMEETDLRETLLLMQLKVNNLKADLEVIAQSIEDLMDDLNKINKGET